MIQRQYAGPLREMVEVRSVEIRDDVPDEVEWRFSTDNGRTWSPPLAQPKTLSYPVGVEVWQGPACVAFDPRAGVLVQTWLRQIAHGGLWHNHTYWRLSSDHGRTWTDPRLFRYEPGADFDPADPLKPEFLQRNQGYFGSNFLLHSSGVAIHALAHANAPGDPGNQTRPWRMGSLCLVGKWDRKARDYHWTAGERVSVTPDISSRGLMEPEIAELRDHRVLVIWRGSDTPTTPGRKWYSVSSDRGLHLTPVRELRYDDGSRFYSPSSYHRMIRHSRTRKLYWLGNICPEPPHGNMPRFPLVIAEVDEAGPAPALKKGTVTVIADREPGQSENVQFSNFSLIENRDTHDLELWLTAYSGIDPKNVNTADCFHYILTPR
jgi:hypothetical protein